MLHKYLTYIRKNPEGYWFKRKLYGWGWVPVRFEGWATLFLYIAILVYLFKEVDPTPHFGNELVIGFVLPFIGITVILIAVCYIKGEPPHWQWGTEYEETKKK